MRKKVRNERRKERAWIAREEVALAADLAKMRRARFDHLAHGIAADLNAMRSRIDALGELGAEISHNDRADMLGCFASNTVYGTQALVEQLMFLVAHPRSKRARWP